MKPVVEVRGLRFRYPDGTQALDGIDFTLGERENVALLGANGSGKTTFALHLVGLLTGDGEVNIGGVRVEPRTAAAIRGKVGMVFQDPDSQLFMPTVLEDVAFGPLNRGLSPAEATEQARSALKAVGMSAAESRAPYHLSAGEKKRVAIAGTLAMEPEVLVLDEPTTFLDPPAQRNLAELLNGLRQSKIVVTHNIRFAQAVCSRAVFFERGKIAGEGRVEEIANRFDWDFAARSIIDAGQR